MKLKDLIEVLSEFNIDADVYMRTIYNDTGEFEVSYISDGDGGKDNAVCVFIETCI